MTNVFILYLFSSFSPYLKNNIFKNGLETYKKIIKKKTLYYINVQLLINEKYSRLILKNYSTLTKKYQTYNKQTELINYIS